MLVYINVRYCVTLLMLCHNALCIIVLCYYYYYCYHYCHAISVLCLSAGCAGLPADCLPAYRLGGGIQSFFTCTQAPPYFSLHKISQKAVFCVLAGGS